MLTELSSMQNDLNRILFSYTDLASIRELRDALQTFLKIVEIHRKEDNMNDAIHRVGLSLSKFMTATITVYIHASHLSS